MERSSYPALCSAVQRFGSGLREVEIARTVWATVQAFLNRNFSLFHGVASTLSPHSILTPAFSSRNGRVSRCSLCKRCVQQLPGILSLLFDASLRFDSCEPLCGNSDRSPLCSAAVCLARPQPQRCRSRARSPDRVRHRSQLRPSCLLQPLQPLQLLLRSAPHRAKPSMIQRAAEAATATAAQQQRRLSRDQLRL